MNYILKSSLNYIDRKYTILLFKTKAPIKKKSLPLAIVGNLKTLNFQQYTCNCYSLQTKANSRIIYSRLSAEDMLAFLPRSSFRNKKRKCRLIVQFISDFNKMVNKKNSKTSNRKTYRLMKHNLKLQHEKKKIPMKIFKQEKSSNLEFSF